MVQKLPAGHYRADGKVASFSSGALSVNYHYDGLDRLVAKVINENGSAYTQSFAHLGKENRVLLGKAGDGSMTTYVDGKGISECLGEVKGGVGRGYITDHLGSVLNAAPAGASKVYGLFGEPSSKPKISLSSPAVEYSYAGYSYSRESGNYETKHRQYAPLSGRWLSQDPIGHLSGDSNYYRYVLNRPLKFSDPLGLEPDGDEDSSDPVPNPDNWWSNFKQRAKDFCGLGDKKEREERQKREREAEQRRKEKEEARQRCNQARADAARECDVNGSSSGQCSSAATYAAQVCYASD